MDEVKQETITAVLVQVSYLISLVDLEDLEAYVQQLNEEHARYDAWAPMLDPTFYRNVGRPAWMDGQTDMARRVLEIRRGIEKMKQTVDPDTIREQAEHIRDMRLPGGDNRE